MEKGRRLRSVAGGNPICFAGIGADADRPAQTVEDDRGIGESAGEIGDFWDLVVVAPGFKGQLARGGRTLPGNPGAEVTPWTASGTSGAVSIIGLVRRSSSPALRKI
jgi:hypothetical protein